MSEPHDTETVSPEESDAFPFATLEPGTAVGDRYEILQLIGIGGSVVVYAAHDRTLKRDVALKVLRADRLTKSSLIRLRREVAEQEVDTAVRANFNLVEERFRRLTGKAPDTRDTPN